MARTSSNKTEDAEVKIEPMEDGALRAAVAAKLCAVIGQMPRLAKDEENKFARYKYVPIDTYYETFAKIAAANGLTWATREVDFRIVDVMSTSEKRGREGDPAQQRSMAQATYAFDVALAGAGILRDYGRITVLHGVTGPQTSGSSASYAEKIFCRIALKAVTGEKDGDAEEPHDTVQSGRNGGHFPGEPEPPRNRAPVQEERRDARRDAGPREEPRREESRREPEPDRGNGHDQDPAMSREMADALERGSGQVSHLVGGAFPRLKEDANDYPVIAEIFRAFAPTLDMPQLQDFWQKNSGVLESMKKDDRDNYNRAAAAVKNRIDDLKEQEKGA